MTPAGVLILFALLGILIVTWALCGMAALNDPERTAPPPPRTAAPQPADPGVAPPPPAPGEAGRDGK